MPKSLPQYLMILSPLHLLPPRQPAAAAFPSTHRYVYDTHDNESRAYSEPEKNDPDKLESEETVMHSS